MKNRNRVFPALLKYWRGQRGFSQFDLSELIEVSSRHLSFLETGRSNPSVEMVLLLSEALDVPLRSRNEMLRAAGFDPRYPEPNLDEVLTEDFGRALEAMLDNHEPLPMIVFDRTYQLVRANRSGVRLFERLWPNSKETNLLKLVFNLESRSVIENWEGFAASSLRRLQRELLYNPDDHELRQLQDELLQHGGVPTDWRQPKLNEISEPLHTIRFRLNERRLSFLMSVTAFDAPQNITLRELHIESWFPLDDATRLFCERVLADPSEPQETPG